MNAALHLHLLSYPQLTTKAALCALLFLLLRVNHGSVLTPAFAMFGLPQPEMELRVYVFVAVLYHWQSIRAFV